MIPTHLGRALRGVLVALEPLTPEDKQRVLLAARNLISFCSTPLVASKPARAAPAPTPAPTPTPTPAPVNRCSVCGKPGHNARRHAQPQPTPPIGALA